MSATTQVAFGKTWSAYLNRDYRGRGVAAQLYEARTEWSRQHANFESAVFLIRESNERFIAIHRKRGAEDMSDEPKRWADGSVAFAHWYKTRLRAAAMAAG